MDWRVRRMRRSGFWVSAGLLAIALGVSPPALAESTGIVGRSGKQGGTYCQACHNNTNIFGTGATIDGPASVRASSVTTYSITVTVSPGSGAINAGFNAATTDGELSTTDPKVQIVPNGMDGPEATHLFPLPEFVNDQVVFTFRLEAPATTGSLTLYAAANASDASNTELGDDPHLATQLAVTVTCDDPDFDGICATDPDNCPTVYNPTQNDCDTDGVGDACDANCSATPGCAGLCVGTCGDGVLDALETCDDAGESATCDIDCTGVTCGDNVHNVTAGEACDDGGQSETCDTDCTVAVCGDGTINLTAGETCESTVDTPTCDGDCTFPVCGDGRANTAAGEICDDGGNSPSCDEDCTLPACGDGIINNAASEACDDGNTDDNDGCSSDCTVLEAGWLCPTAGETCTEVCGDSIRVGVEQCDDGGASATCTAACTLSTCGDGIVNAAASEMCDEGSAAASGGCAVDCTAIVSGWTCNAGESCTTTCGDGIIAGAEECDTSGESLTCDLDCTAAACGDGAVNATASETCDDGNTLVGDGCHDGCQVEVGWSCPLAGGMCATICGDGFLVGAEACDDGALNSNVEPGSCRTNCQLPGCGDGVLDMGETCDNGTLNANDVANACRTDCTTPICGDGVLDPIFGESCDDGNTATGDGCGATCVLEACGNSEVDAGEECDEGINNSDLAPDGCRTNCLQAYCGDGVVDAGESCDDGQNNSDTLPNFCRSTCITPTCGDGVVDLDEECDPGSDGSERCTETCALIEAGGNSSSGCRQTPGNAFVGLLLLGILTRKRAGKFIPIA